MTILFRSKPRPTPEDLLLAHCRLLDDPDPDHPSATIRLEQAIGSRLAAWLASALARTDSRDATPDTAGA